MDFADETYVRCYTRETLTWKQLGREGRVVLRMMLGHFDAAGVFDFRGNVFEAVAAVTDLPLEWVEKGLQRLANTETWLITERQIVWPTYEEAQNCTRSDRQRQRESRRMRATVTSVTRDGGAVTNVTLPPFPPPSAPLPPSSHPPGRDQSARGVSRVYTMPCEEPPQSYLDEATMRAIALEQARSTWEHYWGAGLPEAGVERLHDWLLKRAKERALSQAKLPPPTAKRPPGSPFVPQLEPTDKHRRFAARYGIALEPILREFAEGALVENLGLGRARELLGERLSRAARELRASQQ